MMAWSRGADPTGTSLQGYAPFSYDRIVEVFGEPELGVDGDECAFNWSITFEDGTVASIYDYKASSLYDDGLPTPQQMKDNFTDWHIGGNGWSAVAFVVRALFWWSR